jgi:pheromone a factor receptor
MTPLASIAILLAVPPMIIHVRGGNFAASVLITAVTLLNLQNLLHAAIWNSDDIDNWWEGRILCDIDVKLSLGCSVVIGAATACIFRQIAKILDPDNMAMSASEKSRHITTIVEICLCIVLPITVMISQFFVSRTRYLLQMAVGCTFKLDADWVTLSMVYILPVMLALLGLAYCSLTVVRLCRHRKQMSAALSSSPGKTASRFYRLFALASSVLTIYVPLTVSGLVINVSRPNHEYSWSWLHSPGWADRIIWVTPTGTGFGHISLDHWAQVAAGFILFILFGLGREAREMYKTWRDSLMKLHGQGKRIARNTRERAGDRRRTATNTASTTLIVTEDLEWNGELVDLRRK